MQITIASLIPQALQDKAIDAIVNFLADQAKKIVGDEIATKLKVLRSDAAFRKEFEAGLNRAGQRFIEEYQIDDEDLVEAIIKDTEFFRNQEFQESLLEVIKKPGVYLVEEKQVIEQSFSSILPQRKNRERVNRAIRHLLKCLAEELWHLPELQGIYSLQFQRITAESIREQLAIQKVQLRNLDGLGVEVREALLKLVDGIAENKLLKASNSPKSNEVLQPRHNLPQPSYGRFVGRHPELQQVARLLRPYPHSQEHLVTIDGIGGIGKTSLALAVAHHFVRDFERISSEERFDSIVWISAKTSILTAEGIVSRYHASRTLDDLFSAIATVLERQDLVRIRREDTALAIRNALTRQRTLIILDNLETVDDESAIDFLRDLPAPTKAIVTTRHRLDVAYPVRLTSMPLEDAKKLIFQEAEKKGVKIKDDEVKRLYDRTGGVPLAIVWSIAQTGLGYTMDIVLTRLGQANSDIIRFCFEGAMQHIADKPAYQLMLALSFFADDASRNALEYMTNLPNLDIDDGLVQLEKLSLIARNKKGRFEMSPLTIQLALSKLDAEDTKRFEINYVNYYQQLSKEVTGLDYWGTVRNYSILKTISNEMSNISSS